MDDISKIGECTKRSLSLMYFFTEQELEKDRDIDILCTYIALRMLEGLEGTPEKAARLIDGILHTLKRINTASLEK